MVIIEKLQSYIILFPSHFGSLVWLSQRPKIQCAVAEHIHSYAYNFLDLELFSIHLGFYSWVSSPKLVGIFVLWQPTGQPAKWYLRFKKQKHVWCLYNIHKFEIFQEVLVPFFCGSCFFFTLENTFLLPSVSVQCCCVSISGASGGMLTSKQNLFSLNVLIMNIWGHKILFAQSLFS